MLFIGKEPKGISLMIFIVYVDVYLCIHVCVSRCVRVCVHVCGMQHENHTNPGIQDLWIVCIYT